MSFDARMQNLHGLLHCAMMVELTTVPAYLSASFSLADTSDSGEAKNAEAQELLRTVLVEEMLHMVLVANILNAVGGRPMLDRAEWVPRYPCRLFPDRAKGLEIMGEKIGSSRSLIIHLRRFERVQIEAFMEIEGIARSTGTIDGDISLRSIGQFYGGLAAELTAMVEEYGEDRVFCGRPSRQIGPEYYYAAAGEVFVIDSNGQRPLNTALAAISRISAEGEGLEQGHAIWDGDVIPGGLGEEPAHYFRFAEIMSAKRYRQGAKWGDPPDGEDIEIDWDAVWPTMADPDPDDPTIPAEIAEAMRAFDRRYSALLRQINLAMDGDPALLRPAAADMFELKSKGVALMRMPLGDGRTAGPAWRFVD